MRPAGCLCVRGAYFLLCRTFLFCGFFGLFSLLRLGAAAGFGALGAFFLFSSALLLFYGLALTLGLDFGGFFSLFGLFCLGAAAGLGALGAFFEFSSAFLLLFYGLALTLDLDFCGFFSLFGLLRLSAAVGFGAFGAFFLFSGALFLLFCGLALALALGLDFCGLFGLVSLVSLVSLFCLGAAAGFGALGAFFEFSSALLLLFCGLALALDLDFCGFFSLFGLFCSADLRDLVAADGLAAFGAFLWFFRWRLGSGWGRRLRGGGFGGRRGRF